MPTASDLVTDLPADFEVFGQAVDTSLADLKGGTTGQVLSKASNTDMDFTWVAQDDSNAIQNAIVDAKGDLIAASAADTPARLAVGNNGETLVADSSTSTGLRYTENYAAGKNKIINGDMSINQRNFTSSTTSGDYVFDRFRFAYTTGTVTASTQTFTPGAAPVAGYEASNFARIATTGQSASNAQSRFQQAIEDVRTFAGQTVTVSFWAKADTGTPKVFGYFGQNFGSGGSSFVDIYGSAVTISTSWARYSITVAIPSISGKTIGTGSLLSVILWTSAGSGVATIGSAIGIQNATIDFWGVQAEAGSVATAFQTATGTLQGELAACQRYLPSVMAAGNTWLGYATATNNSYTQVSYPVQARVAPTGISVPSLAGNFTLFAASGGSGTPTAINFDSAGVNSALIQVITTVGSPTLAAGTTTALRGASGSSYILFTGCEL